ncbi:urease accessory protein [Roseivivax halotolerans]|uniref:Urease accessory protein UreD n=1 Tax=Roseivivax halotolerans TaxID=93684 RepID=A0A1I5WFV4_9RHOB|nr:urease accessory protein UreD [Roseivivax halotolerans]SFQ18581.1 urease accessory protein [Roseivivax halotolerans]
MAEDRAGSVAIPYDRSHDGAALTRARGRASLSVRHARGASRLRALGQSGSAKLLFPHGAGEMLQTTWLNTAGGITGGDRFALDACAEDGAALSLTSQAAERIYRARGAETGRMTTRLSLGAGARLHWLPQETIFFQGAALDRNLQVEMAQDATFLGIETLIFGRAAMGEDVTQLNLRDRIELRRAGRLIHSDRLALRGDARARLGGAHVAGGARAMASLVIAAPGIDARLPAIRDFLPARGGASAPLPGLVVARILADDGFDIRQRLVPLLRYLSGSELPRPWMI